MSLKSKEYLVPQHRRFKIYDSFRTKRRVQLIQWGAWMTSAVLIGCFVNSQIDMTMFAVSGASTSAETSAPSFLSKAKKAVGFIPAAYIGSLRDFNWVAPSLADEVVRKPDLSLYDEMSDFKFKTTDYWKSHYRSIDDMSPKYRKMAAATIEKHTKNVADTYNAPPRAIQWQDKSKWVAPYKPYTVASYIFPLVLLDKYEPLSKHVWERLANSPFARAGIPLMSQVDPELVKLYYQGIKKHHLFYQMVLSSYRPEHTAAGIGAFYAQAADVMAQAGCVTDVKRLDDYMATFPDYKEMKRVMAVNGTVASVGGYDGIKKYKPYTYHYTKNLADTHGAYNQSLDGVVHDKEKELALNKLAWSNVSNTCKQRLQNL